MNISNVNSCRVASPSIDRHSKRGFVLIATVSLMALLLIIAVAMLSLSTVELRSGGSDKAMAEANENAKMALMLAIGELQKEMGPDMRVSAEAALFDQDEDSDQIDGVSQSRWLASYNSWGGWLNADYTLPDGGSTLQIQDTYTKGREKMFRRWLVSLPEEMVNNIDAPIDAASLDDSNSVVLVGEGTLGEAALDHPDQITRAYLSPVGERGRQAWWIGPENHKARIDLASQPRSLGNDEWETAQGDTAEVGIGVLPGFDGIDSDESLSDKLVTLQTLGTAGVDAGVVGKHFFDLTASSRGVLASVRTGHLKKDLSLLFEKEKSGLPDLYRLDAGDIREPSIRPMSPELAAENPKLPERHFASWTRMRHFYRMYRQDSDAIAPAWSSRGTDGSPGLVWSDYKPSTDPNLSLYFSPSEGKDTYTRFPILTSITYILSLKADIITGGRNAGKYDLRYVASPVCVYWNPYNVELRVPNEKMAMRSYLGQVHTMDGQLYLGDTFNREVALRFDDDYARMMSGTGDELVFKPGEFRIFSPRGDISNANKLNMLPGFDPQSFGGLYAGMPGCFQP